MIRPLTTKQTDNITIRIEVAIQKAFDDGEYEWEHDGGKVEDDQGITYSITVRKNVIGG